MKKFISKEKLSKKAKRAKNAEQRVVWAFRPATKVKKSAKLYDRKRLSETDDDRKLFFYCCS